MLAYCPADESEVGKPTRSEVSLLPRVPVAITSDAANKMAAINDTTTTKVGVFMEISANGEVVSQIDCDAAMMRIDNIARATIRPIDSAAIAAFAASADLDET